MIYGIGQTVRLRARFKASGVAPGALTVVCTIRDIDGTAVVNAQAATSLGDGFYAYDAYVATEVGPLVFFFHATVGTVDVAQMEGVVYIVESLGSGGLSNVGSLANNSMTAAAAAADFGAEIAAAVAAPSAGAIASAVAGALDIPTESEIVTALLGTTVDGAIDLREFFVAALAVLTGVTTDSSGTVTAKRRDGTTTAWTWTVNSESGIRTASTPGTLA